MSNEDKAMTAPVDLARDGNRSLLLGMKADRDYSFRLLASMGSETCMSVPLDVRTEPLPDNIPVIITTTVQQAGALRPFLAPTKGPLWLKCATI